jgi:hypothetical protein
MCEQDDAVVRVATHVVTQLEAQGLSAMEHVDRYICLYVDNSRSLLRMQ